MGVARPSELQALAENWCIDNLGPYEDPLHKGLNEIAANAYRAGYDQAIQDVKEGL